MLNMYIMNVVLLLSVSMGSLVLAQRHRECTPPQASATVANLEGVPSCSQVINASENPVTPRMVRGSLFGMDEQRRLQPRYYLYRGQGDLLMEDFNKAMGGSEHFGFGLRPESDPMKTKWWQVNRQEAKRLRFDLREKLFEAIGSQSRGDPRKVALSWSQVTFSNSRIIGPDHNRLLRYRFHFPTGILGMHVTGELIIPMSVINSGKKAPAVIYQHFHGGLHGVGTNEIWNNWSYAELSGSPVWALARRGIITIATDVHGFNKRRLDDAFRKDTEKARIVRQGGREMPDVQDELSDTEIFYRHGMSRYGVRSFEDYLVYRLIKQHPLVKSDRIATMGMSMGGVRANTLGALAGRGLKVVVANGTFPRFYMATNREGNYRIWAHKNTHHLFDQYENFGFDTEHLAFLAAETNYIAQMGDQDGSSPGYRQIFQMLKDIELLGDGRVIVQETQGGGHSFTYPNLFSAYTLFENLLK